MSPAGSIAFFISPHGLGHAARAAALAEEIHRQSPELGFLFISRAPAWFFAESLTARYERIELAVDVGLVQRSATEEDLEATVSSLGRLYPPRPRLVDRLAGLLRDHRCVLAVADIAPIGLVAASAAEIPAVLVENFTWDWIYRGYEEAREGLAPFRRLLGELFRTADLHLQAEPVCRRVDGAVRVGPIARHPRRGREATREMLGVDPTERLVTVTMGGVPERLEIARELEGRPERFLLVGQSPDDSWPENVIALPHRSGFPHPDLLMATDVLVGKLGYSTVVEAWRAAVDWIWLDRPAFAETAVLAEHVRRHHRQVRLEPGALGRGGWTAALDCLTGPRPAPSFEDGAPAAAAAILRQI